MDKNKAKFVLQSFRPDGADTKDGDFAEALQLATEDRELGEWLVRERAFDAEFAEALARVDLPRGLRESILLAMVQDGRDFPKADMAEEGKWILAMAGIEVPTGLRERVLTAMEQTANVHQPRFGWRRIGIPLAAAAGIAMAFVLLREPAGLSGRAAQNDAVLDSDRKVPIRAVAAGFVRTFESPIFSLDKTDGEMPEMITYLRGKDLPCGKGYLPPGLKDCQGIGCRELVIEGVKGSLICFDDEDGTIHLVIFRKADLQGELPGISNPEMTQSGDWASASWEENGFVFVMMGMRDKSKFSRFF